MDLFVVQRYMEKDEQESVTNDSNTENQLLQRLLDKVEKRKKLKYESEKHRKTEQQEKHRKTELIEQKALDAEEDIEGDEGAAAATDINDNDGQIAQNLPDSNDNQPHEGFQVLGENDNSSAKEKSVEVLPSWLAHPIIISTNITAMDVDHADPTDDNRENALSTKKLSNASSYLDPQLIQTLLEMGINELFPVQETVIPWLLEAHSKPLPFRPRDICVSAPTGSGKTLAFALPVVQLLLNRVKRQIRALVILPVTELAVQVFKVFRKLCEKTDLTVYLLCTQNAFHVEQEQLVEQYKGNYYSKVDILVSTPGRLVDHIHGTKGFSLTSLQFLVLDEADRIMDDVFQNWLYHLDGHVRTTTDQLFAKYDTNLCYNQLELSCGRQPHKLLFSATLSNDPEKLQDLKLFHPKLFTSMPCDFNTDPQKANNSRSVDIDMTTTTRTVTTATTTPVNFIGKYSIPMELKEKYCLTEMRLKPLTLFALIKEHKWTKFLCFTNSVESSKRLTFILNHLFDKMEKVRELSAALNAKTRNQILTGFSRGKIMGVVCSDALARGIDIPYVDVVISYDPPRHIRTHIHRIGRTARAGRSGTAVTLLSQKEFDTFTKTLAEGGKMMGTDDELPVSTAIEEMYANKYSTALKDLRQKIINDKRYKLYLKQTSKQQAHIHKDNSKMTLMQKLQLQATTEIQNIKEHVSKEIPKLMGKAKVRKLK